MSLHYFMIPDEILRLIRKYHKTRNLQLAAKICEDLYKQAKRYCAGFSEDEEE